jgi:flagellar transcriptional activator FlhD
VNQPKMNRLLSDLKDMNLNFLMLAQKMLIENRVTAKAQLGISELVAEQILRMGMSEMLRLASTSQSLCMLRFDDEKLWQLAIDNEIDARVSGLHASILSFRPGTEQKLAC